MSCMPVELQWDYGTLKNAWFNIVHYVNNSVSTPPAIQKLLKLETCESDRVNPKPCEDLFSMQCKSGLSDHTINPITHSRRNLYNTNKINGI